MRTIERRAIMLGLNITQREGANHTVVTVGKCTAAIPRHRELPTGTCHSIMKDFEEEFGKRWLK